MHSLCVRFAAFVASLLFLTSQAFAQAPCEQIVVDTAGVLRDIPAVEAAARELEAHGAVVRVRVAPDHSPSPNLDQHIDAVRAGVCQSWTGGDGEIRRNMIVLYVTMNRQLGLYFGDQWDSELERSWPSIAGQTMKPLLQAGRLDQALVAALNRITTIAEGDSAIATAPAVVESVTVRAEPREPFDWTPIAWVLALIVFVLALIFGGRRVYGLWEHHNKVEGARRGKQQEAINAFGEARALIESVHKLKDKLTPRLTSEQGEELTKWAGATQLSSWSAKLTAIDSRLASPEGAFNNLTDPHGEGGTVEEYEQVLQATNGILENLRALNTELIELSSQIQTAETNHRDFPALKARVTEVVSGARDRISAVKGFKVEGFLTALQEAEEKGLTSADALFGERHYTEATEKLNALEVVVTTLAQDAEHLPERKRTLLAGVHTVEGTLQSLKALRENTRATFTSIEARFAPRCIGSVIGNGSQAEKLLAEVHTICRDIIRSADAEDWVSAETALTRAEALVDEAEGLLSAIEELRERLEADHSAATDEVAEADRSIKVAREYLEAHPEDTSAAEHAPKLKEAERLLEKAEQMLAETRPDVVEALKVAMSADEHADDVYEKAVSDYEAAERKRARAAKLARDVESALDEAERYQRNHSSDVGSDAKRRLREAREAWDAQRRTPGDIDQLIIIATSVNSDVGSALSSAKNDVRSAESANTGGGSISWNTPSSHTTGGGSMEWSSPASDPSPGTGGGSTSW